MNVSVKMILLSEQHWWFEQSLKFPTSDVEIRIQNFIYDFNLHFNAPQRKQCEPTPIYGWTWSAIPIITPDLWLIMIDNPNHYPRSMVDHDRQSQSLTPIYGWSWSTIPIITPDLWLIMIDNPNHYPRSMVDHDRQSQSLPPIYGWTWSTIPIIINPINPSTSVNDL